MLSGCVCLPKKKGKNTHTHRMGEFATASTQNQTQARKALTAGDTASSLHPTTLPTGSVGRESGSTPSGTAANSESVRPRSATPSALLKILFFPLLKAAPLTHYSATTSHMSAYSKCPRAPLGGQGLWWSEEGVQRPGVSSSSSGSLLLIQRGRGRGVGERGRSK